jgi:DNA adenine methylase
MDQLSFYTILTPITAEPYHRTKNGLKTYLRYPGGKSRAIKNMSKYVPEFSEYRESMIGGGSMFLYLKKNYPDKKYWINDIYYNLYIFWVSCRDNNDALIDTLLKMKSDTTKETSGELFKAIKESINSQDDLTRAAYFYYLNKCSFSGLSESGTCSPQAWVQNFSQSAIESLYDLKFFLQDVRITNLDYKELFNQDGEGVFIYADPPYDIGKANVLYGRNGETHKNFDHERFADDVKNCKHKILVSYNDSPLLRERFSFMHVEDLPFKYTMRITKKETPTKKELIMRNYV